jgi:hypothetical protein
MPLLRMRSEADREFKKARHQVDLALDRMAKILEEVEEQVNKAKEELDERRTS